MLLSFLSRSFFFSSPPRRNYREIAVAQSARAACARCVCARVRAMRTNAERYLRAATDEKSRLFVVSSRGRGKRATVKGRQGKGGSVLDGEGYRRRGL